MRLQTSKIQLFKSTAPIPIGRSSTSLKYLYEFASIPSEIRLRFLNKLLKRRNSENQKNVRLLKIIYSHITEDRMLEWNEETISDSLGISLNMLYCHKSWLLKSIRLLYFGWKEIEKEVSFGDLKDGKNLNGSYMLAKKMMEAGMRRESKVKFLKLERTILLKRRKSWADKELLFLVSRHLCQHYYSLKKEKEFNKYYKLALRYFRMLLKRASGNMNALKPEILVNYYYCLSYKPTFNGKKIEAIKEGRMYLEEAYSVSQSTPDHIRQSELIINIANLYSIEPSGFPKAALWIEEGIALARIYGLTGDYYTLKILELFFDYIMGKQKIKEAIESMKKYYAEFEASLPRTSLKRIVLMKAVFLSSSYANSGLLHFFFSKLYSFEILNYGYNASFRTLYSAKFQFYLDNLFEALPVRSPGGKIYITSGELRPAYYKKLLNTFDELLVSFHRITDLYFVKEIYTYILLSDVCCPGEFDPEKCTYTISKIEWLNRSRGKVITEANHRLFEALKFFAKMRGDIGFLSKEDFVIKYEKEYSKAAKNFLQGEVLTSLMYYIFSYMARITGYREFEMISRNIFLELEEKYPGFFEHAIAPVKHDTVLIAEEEKEFAEFVSAAGKYPAA